MDGCLRLLSHCWDEVVEVLLLCTLTGLELRRDPLINQSDFVHEH